MMTDGPAAGEPCRPDFFYPLQEHFDLRSARFGVFAGGQCAGGADDDRMHGGRFIL